MTGGSIGTTGAAAYAVAVNHGGAISLNGTTVTATGRGSGGLGIDGAASTLNATGVTISTMGGHDPVSGQNAYAVYNGPYGDLLSGGTASLTNSSVATSGAEMVGVYTGAGGTTTLTGTNVATGGIGAVGVESLARRRHQHQRRLGRHLGPGRARPLRHRSGSTANLSGSGTFATQGAGAIGLYATFGGVISATGSATTTSRPRAAFRPRPASAPIGVNADGAGSQVKLGAATITTSGAGATGLFASDATGSGSAGTITATGTLKVNDHQRRRRCGRAAGQRRVDPRDRRRDDHLRGQTRSSSRRDEPDRDLRQFHHQQPLRRSDLRRSLGRDRQFQQHDRQRRDRTTSSTRPAAAVVTLNANASTLDRRDPDRPDVDLQRQPRRTARPGP